MKIFNLFNKSKKNNDKQTQIKNKNIIKLSQIEVKDTQSAKNKSYALYDVHSQLTNVKNLSSIKINKNSNVELNEVEISFLKFIINQDINTWDLPVYWSYEYNINYQNIMEKYIENDFIFISTQRYSIHNLKVPELKAILKDHKLQLSGKKDVLIERIEFNIKGTLDLAEDKTKQYISLTEKGLMLVNNSQKSVTKDIDFENKCLQLINEQKFVEAYDIVCKYELSKNIPRGLGMDWENEVLGTYREEKFNVIWNCKDSSIISNELIPCEYEIKSIVIFCNMLGKNPCDGIALFRRISNVYIESNILRIIFSTLDFLY